MRTKSREILLGYHHRKQNRSGRQNQDFKLSIEGLNSSEHILTGSRYRDRRPQAYMVTKGNLDRKASGALLAIAELLVKSTDSQAVSGKKPFLNEGVCF